MLLQPKTAIAFRDEMECKLLQQILQRQGLNADILDGRECGRAYICPPEYRDRGRIFVEWSLNPDNTSGDKADPFEWTYLETSKVFKNQLISERRKRNVT